MNTIKNKKIIVILGPTASGKTGLGVKLAHKYNGEIVSADSRQVYKGMDVGTGKDLEEYIINSKISAQGGCASGAKIQKSPPKADAPRAQKIKKYKIIKIPYHLIDIVSPKTQFSLAKYQKLAYKAIDDILKRGKLPILVGGTGLYLQAVVDGYNLSRVKPDKVSRAKLEKKSVDRLFALLKKINHKFAGKLNESDKKNKRRLIRYLEIANPPVGGRQFTTRDGKKNNKYGALLIGVSRSREVLRERIYKRLIERLEKENMIYEVKKLHKQGVSWKRLESFGLEYKYISLYLRKKLTYDEMVEKLNTTIRQFAKKQISWFRRWERQGREINWVKNRGEAERLARKFIAL